MLVILLPYMVGYSLHWVSNALLLAFTGETAQHPLSPVLTKKVNPNHRPAPCGAGHGGRQG